MKVQTTVKFLTTRQLARLWHVSEATIKRWADAGHLNFTRTVGGHRRFALEEVARFQSERDLGASTERPAAGRPATHDGAGRVDSARLFFEAVTNCDERAAAALLIESYLDGASVAAIFDETVAGAMERVGTLWHGGQLSVADEHLATRTTIRAVESLSISIKRRYTGARLAVCCGVEGELHDIGVVGLQILLEGESWSVRNLGGNTPFFALADAVERLRPALVCISATMHYDPERGAREYRQFREIADETGARVVLGGSAFRDESICRRFPADLYANNFRELIDFIRKHSHSFNDA